MKTLFSKARLIACIATLMGAGLSFAGVEANQPHMEAAVTFLQEAKKADNPLPALEKALHELKVASHNKSGWRLKAIQMVDEAIAKANEGDNQVVAGKCSNAIAEIHTGMSKAR